jgi:hypothetical protein
MLWHLVKLVKEENFEQWLSGYPELKNNNLCHPKVLIKPNVNYSFAGIHEWLCCTVTQTPFIIEADKDQYLLLKFLCKKMIEHNPSLAKLFNFSSDKFHKADQYILYTEKKNDSIIKYFRTKKALIIEPRPTLALLTGKETQKDLADFGKDIFIHFGQSNRSLRKVFIPSDYEIRKLIEALEPYASVYQNNKYANNYDYHQSVFLMNRIPFLDNGFLIFKEDKSHEAPTGCLFYEYYKDLNDVLKTLESYPHENLICAETLPLKCIRPGKSHFYELSDYPNNNDLIEFLIS